VHPLALQHDHGMQSNTRAAQKVHLRRADSVSVDATLTHSLASLSQITMSKIGCVEYSKGSQATCDQRLCKSKILKGEIRFGIPTNIMGNQTIKWRHLRCCIGYQKLA
jgi:hypothetical protein